MGTARENFDDSVKFIKAIQETILEIIKNFTEYAEFNAKYAAEKEMAKWIHDGNMPMPYKVRGKCDMELVEELRSQGIPHLYLLNHTLYVKPEDMNRVEEINQHILLVKGNYYQETDTNLLENAIAASPKVKDKNIITLHGLNKYQCEALKNKCNNITKGFMVGVAEENGCYSLSIHAPWTISNDVEKVDFCKAYSEMALSLYGLNSVLKEKQIEADEKLDKQVASLKGCVDTHYVIGVDDPSKYIELNANGFELHRIRLINGEIKNCEVSSVDVNNPDYEVELQKCMDGIFNKTVIDNEDKLHEHLNIRQRNIDTNRPEKNAEQTKISEMEDALVEKANEMIKTGPIADSLFSMNPQDAFIAYQNEMKTIFTKIAEGQPVIGYRDEDINILKDTFAKADVDPKDYLVAVNSLQKYQIEMHKAKELEKTMENYKSTNGRNKEDYR